MDEESQNRLSVHRVFSQSADAVSFYCDFTQILGTGEEVILQFYEPIPALPGEDGRVTEMQNRLRATVVVSSAHAGKIAKLLEKHLDASRDPRGTSRSPQGRDTDAGRRP